MYGLNLGAPRQPWIMQHHQPGMPPESRADQDFVRLATRGTGYGPSVLLHGKVRCFHAWPSSHNGQGFPGGAWAWPSQIANPADRGARPVPTATAVAGEPVSVLTTTPRGSVLPTRGGFHDRDTRYEQRYENSAPWASSYPRAWPGVMTAGSEDGQQHDVWVPGFPGCVAANGSGRGGVLGTKVFDVAKDGDIDLRRVAQFQSAFRVAPWENTGVLAWQLGLSGEEDKVRGYGATCDFEIPNPDAQPDVKITDANFRALVGRPGVARPNAGKPPAPEMVLAWQSHRGGGPLVVAPKGDQHDRSPVVGTPAVAGHLHARSLYWSRGIWDCPLDLEEAFEPLIVKDRTDGEAWRVHCQVDGDAAHTAPDGIGGATIGRWHIRLPIEDIPDQPPGIPRPEQEWRSLAGVGVGARGEPGAPIEGGPLATYRDFAAPAIVALPQHTRGRDIARGSTEALTVTDDDRAALADRPQPAKLEAWAKQSDGAFVSGGKGGFVLRGYDELGAEDVSNAGLAVEAVNGGYALAVGSVDEDSGKVVSGWGISAKDATTFGMSGHDSSGTETSYLRMNWGTSGEEYLELGADSFIKLPVRSAAPSGTPAAGEVWLWIEETSTGPSVYDIKWKIPAGTVGTVAQLP